MMPEMIWPMIVASAAPAAHVEGEDEQRIQNRVQNRTVSVHSMENAGFHPRGSGWIHRW